MVLYNRLGTQTPRNHPPKSSLISRSFVTLIIIPKGIPIVRQDRGTATRKQRRIIQSAPRPRQQFFSLADQRHYSRNARGSFAARIFLRPRGHISQHPSARVHAKIYILQIPLYPLLFRASPLPRPSRRRARFNGDFCLDLSPPLLPLTRRPRYPRRRLFLFHAALD